MKRLIKVALLPVKIGLTIFTGTANFILGSRIINMAFIFASGLLFLGFIGLTWSAIFVQTDMPLIARILLPGLALLASYLTNPSGGVIKLLCWLIGRIEGINSFLRHI